MNNSIAKSMKRLAEIQTIGQSKEYTQGRYKDLKAAYKPHAKSRKEVKAQIAAQTENNKG